MTFPPRSSRRVASDAGQAYLPAMVVRRILQLLTMLAVMLMPVGMLTGGAAAAMGHDRPAAAMTMSEHCAATHHIPKKSQPSKPATDCTVSCAAIPSAETRYEHAAMAPQSHSRPALTPLAHGLHPEAATPPPRSA